SLQCFLEFFASLPDAETGQVFGVLRGESAHAGHTDGVWAEAETKRLNRQFQELILRLDERRPLVLMHEPEPRRKPAIYEFPREFKKIRTPLVQFLVDVFKPDPLSVGPRLAGFFFTGTLPRESAGAPMPTLAATRQWGTDATQVFQGDSTIFQ